MGKKERREKEGLCLCEWPCVVRGRVKKKWNEKMREKRRKENGKGKKRRESGGSVGRDKKEERKRKK